MGQAVWIGFSCQLSGFQAKARDFTMHSFIWIPVLDAAHRLWNSFGDSKTVEGIVPDGWCHRLEPFPLVEACKGASIPSKSIWDQMKPLRPGARCKLKSFENKKTWFCMNMVGPPIGNHALVCTFYIISQQTDLARPACKLLYCVEISWLKGYRSWSQASSTGIYCSDISIEHVRNKEATKRRVYV